ncbi:peptidylprolyl isomerase [Candidatus Sulfidibacterium hydrothermale]|uniref:peptidylprolyl isomerase n=1 Tax=Candidatus Sulfidibacterium hydrothermale TaxID=2875962 RepID=UPI001F0A5A95|nr:peptidylprolyl isomerase [Candidatus Sulfidibacterium hydrothermale]UBM63203.1 peptidylprolyl isomerase [Candidatus Sulfidibacterium hydrothermale]
MKIQNNKIFQQITRTTLVTFLLIFMGYPVIFAQKEDSLNRVPKGKILDEVVAVVGNKLILKSDIENQYMNYRMQGAIQGTAEDMKCEILESLLYQRLMVAQAEVDSITVDESQVNAELERRLSGFINQFGSQEKLEKYYGKSISQIKAEIHDIVKDQMLAQQVQQKIISNITVTPSEIRQYFNSLPKDSIPMIKTEYVIRQIVREPPVNLAEKLRVKKELLQLRKRILNGESFSTLAILYSQDPGSAKNGGELGFYGRGQLYPAFEAAAYKLKPGEISGVVETKAGYHIIQMIARKGDYIDVRHILLIPKVSAQDLQKAKMKLDTIVQEIRSDSITFDEAVEKYSQGPNKNNGGYLLNPQTGGTEFEGEQLDPQVSFIVDKMKPGEISNPVPFKTEDGKDAYRLLYLEKRIPPHKANLKQDYPKIEQWALQDKQRKAIDKWINEKARQTYIRIIPEYRSCHFRHHWLPDQKRK